MSMYENVGLTSLDYIEEILHLRKALADVSDECSKAYDKIANFEQQRWVSVKDRLPEKHGWYLVSRKKTYPTDSGMQVCFFCHGRFMVDKKIKITHWRPLPEYPIEEVEKENDNE